MSDYQNLKKKYERLYNETLEKNKEILIESFIEYYGEKHRDEIISRFNEIVFIYFIDWERYSNDSFLRFKEYFLENEQIFSKLAKEMSQDLEKLLKYREKRVMSLKTTLLALQVKK